MAKRDLKPLVLLVNPGRKYRYNWDLEEVCAVMGRKAVSHPLALPLLAALTPPRYDVQIVDEQYERLAPKRRPAVVGITAMVSNIDRAFALADDFRAQGIPVVLGGPQITADPDAALAHADRVVTGEAEGTWETVLADIAAGRPRRRYACDAPVPFSRSPLPRWDLVDTSKVMTLAVQVSRGCPFRCEFCLVHEVFGRSQRYRAVDDVVAELEALPIKRIAFADDNLTADKTYARELLERMAPLRLSWSCQASLDTAYDEELVGLMARAGCNSILIGFESLDPESLREARKSHNILARYERAIANVHAAGIHIIASFVVGFDADTKAAFDDIAAFTRKNGLSYVMVNALAAYPGTEYHRRMRREGRLLAVETSFVNGIYPTVRYKNITPSEMMLGCLDALHRIYDYEAVADKAVRLLGNGAFAGSRDVGIGIAAKARSTAYLALTHIFTLDRHKRRLFLDLLRLVRRGVAHIGQVIPFLLFIASVRGYLAFSMRHKDAVLEQIRRACDAKDAALPAARRRQPAVPARLLPRAEERSPSSFP